MKTCLIAMPFAPAKHPQPALGVLKAYVRLHAPDQVVDCRYEYIRLWESMMEQYEHVGEILADLIYVGHLYPEKKELVQKKVSGGAIASNLLKAGNDFLKSSDLSADTFEKIFQTTGIHLDRLVDELASKYEVIGFSTTFAQFFSSLALASRLKQKNPMIRIVLGGFHVAHSPRNIMDAFPFVDFVVPGEGEQALVDLLNGLDMGQRDFPPESGIVTRENTTPSGFNQCFQVARKGLDLDQLPIPDFQEYLALSQEVNFIPYLLVEGGRGCFWNRVEQTKNPFAACYFCGFNQPQESRQKSTARLADEVEQLTNAFQSLNFSFIESSFRAKGVIELAQALKKKNKDFIFCCNPRSNIAPIELLELWEAGCMDVAPGIEGLSSAFLKRIHKGSTAIQVLQTMKTCFELGIHFNCNFIVDFPGTTQNEIDETVGLLLDYAICYLPGVVSFSDTNIIPFMLEPFSTVCRRPDYFGIRNVRNRQIYRDCLPSEVERHLILGNLDYDALGPCANWGVLPQALRQVRDLYQQLLEKSNHDTLYCKPLYYMDAGSYINIVDQRKGLVSFTLENEWREVYLFCSRIRSHQEVLEKFSEAARETVEKEILPALVSNKLVFAENHHYLSLAAAIRPELAAKRIRMQAQ